MSKICAFTRSIAKKASMTGSEICGNLVRRMHSSTFLYLPLIAVIGLMIVPFVSQAQDSLPSQIGYGDEYTLKLNANMVILSATVLDRHNVPVSGLGKDDFQVYEDGQLQRITQFSHDDIPVTAGILVDNSWSMGPKRDDVVTAALAFARSSNPQDQMFVVNFNDRVSFGLPPGMLFTDRREELQMALSRIRTIGQTSLYDGVLTALGHLKLGTSDKKVLILISDGGDNASKHSLAQVLDMAKQTMAIIYAIGIFDEQDGDNNPDALRRLAKETGGKAYFPASSKEVVSLCEGIARDIRSQYTLAYVPAITTDDGSYRTVRVLASAHGRGRLSVRTRPGYSVQLTMPAGSTKTIPHDSRN
jgi:VWFA-related protein